MTQAKRVAVGAAQASGNAARPRPALAPRQSAATSVEAIGSGNPFAAFPGLSYLRVADVVRNMTLLVAAADGRAPGGARLKPAYARVAARIQKLPLCATATPRLRFRNSAIFRAATRHGLFEGEDIRIRQTQRYRTAMTRRVSDARRLILSASPALLGLIDSVTTDILCVESRTSEAGTAGDLIGIIWLGPTIGEEVTRVAEHLVHEATHLSLYLDDMVNGLFRNRDAMWGRAGTAVSTFLRKERPFCLAFHSACVAVAVFHFRSRVGERIDPGEVRALRRCIAALQRKERRFLSERGQELLGQLAVLAKTTQPTPCRNG